MEISNKFSMTVLSRSVNEGFVRTAVAAFAAQLDPTLEEINDIKTAVSEAVTNCIVHAYSEGLGKIYISVEIADSNIIKIKIRDTGCGIADVEKAMSTFYTSLGGDRAGLGFTVMESFMDSVRVRSVVGRGTTVTLSKKIAPRYNLNGSNSNSR